jgi:hypothetical protein
MTSASISRLPGLDRFLPAGAGERGKISGHDVLARCATATGGRLHQAIYFDDGDITAIA